MIELAPRRAEMLTTAAWSIVAAFGAYFCVYFYRKSFTAAGYGDVGFKTLLVTAQVLGYALSKFIGIKVVAEMPPTRRAVAILMLTGIAWAALFGFAVVPSPYNVVFLFINGIPLGMVFGLVLGFLEGRQMTEATTAGLCTSFILADGVTKSLGAQLLAAGCSEYWMPFVAGLIVAPALLVFVWMLTRIPPPSRHDVMLRSERVPMPAVDRQRFYARFATGLTLLIVAYLLITILRSLRADFAREVWQGLGETATPELFIYTELYVGLGVMLVSGMSVLIRDNRTAFFTAMAVSLAGLALIGLTLVLLNGGQIGGVTFMILIGLGLYFPYVAVHTTVFERLIAMTRDRANLGYLMLLADAFGYLGYVATMLTVRYFGSVDFLSLFTFVCWVTAIAGFACFAGSLVFFATRRTQAA